MSAPGLSSSCWTSGSPVTSSLPWARSHEGQVCAVNCTRNLGQSRVAPALVAGWNPCYRLDRCGDGSSGRSVSPSVLNTGRWGRWPGRAAASGWEPGPASASVGNLQSQPGSYSVTTDIFHPTAFIMHSPSHHWDSFYDMSWLQDIFSW